MLNISARSINNRNESPICSIPDDTNTIFYVLENFGAIYPLSSPYALRICTDIVNWTLSITY
jgi:hypothetical protein